MERKGLRPPVSGPAAAASVPACAPTPVLHRSEQKYGENIFSSWSSRPGVVVGGAAVDSWYEEV